jgi:hypothetical protein
MFIALGFLFLVIGAYIYFDIIKKASKVVLDTPKNFKNLSKSLQKKNIDRTLIRLMAAMAVGVSRSQSGTGRFLQIDYDNVSKIQKALLFDMIGPMNKDEIKKECFDRFLNNPKISQIEKQGLEHVLNNFLNK